MRECGLKYFQGQPTCHLICVTPCAGVWIEILDGGNTFTEEMVTPCAGVWIEINVESKAPILIRSLPVRECGLK